MNPTPLPWRIQVYPSGGWRTATPTTLEPGDGVLSLDALNRTPGGGCLDGQITAIPTLAGLQPRDEITVEVQNTSTLAWTPIYAGVVMTCGNPRSSSPQAHRLAGIQQRAYELIVQLSLVPGDDVADMVKAVVSESKHRPAGVTYTAGNVPTLTLVNGDRSTAYETVGDFLDAMTQITGAFAVPTGETYTYDGRTYAAGQVVPPTEWGIKPDGSLYFRRVQTGAHEMSETDARTSVEWTPVNAEDDVTDTLLVYAGTLNTTDAELQRVFWQNPSGATGPTLPAGGGEIPLPLRPIARLNGREIIEGNTPTHVTRVQLDGPQDYMQKIALTVTSSTGATDAGNAIDGDPDTKATYNGTPTITPFTIKTNASTANDGAWRIRYGIDATSNLALTARLTYDSTTGPTSESTLIYVLPPTSGATRDIWLPAPTLSGYTGPLDSLRPSINFLTVTMIDHSIAAYIHEVEYWVPDGDVNGDASRSAKLADALRRQASTSVARAATRGLGPVTRDLTIHPATGSDVTAAIERITYSLTPADGAMTTYYAGQAWPAAIREQQVMLTRLARRAVAEGGRRR